MATRNVIFRSCDCLPCSDTPEAPVIICIPSDLIAMPACPERDDTFETYEYRTIEGILASTCKGTSSKTYCYVISYDDELTTGYQIKEADIEAVFCKDCLTNYIEDVAGGEVYLRNEEDASITLVSQHGCEYNFTPGGVCISEDEGNVLIEDDLGCLYVPTSEVCISEDEGNVLTLDELGCLFVPASEVCISEDEGNILVEDYLGCLYVPAGAGGEGWALLGNAGTVDGTNFRGTTDNVADELRVNNLRARRTVPNPVSPIIIDGGPNNYITGEAESTGCAILSGGGDAVGNFGDRNYIYAWDEDTNEVDFNAPGGLYSLIGGGSQCFIESDFFETSDQDFFYRLPGWSAVLSGFECFVQNAPINPYYYGGHVVCGGAGNWIIGGAESFVGGGSFCAINVNYDSGEDVYFSGWDGVVCGIANEIDSYPESGYNPYYGSPYGALGNVIGGGDTNGIRNGWGCAISGGILGEIAPAGFLHDSLIIASGILTGQSNEINGSHSSILGGGGLTLGNYSLGFQNRSAVPSWDAEDLSPVSAVDPSVFDGMFFLGDTDLWMANVGNNASKLKFFEPNTVLDFSTTNFSSFRAQAQGANIEYIWPAAAGIAGDSLKIQSVVGTTVTLEWAA